MSYLRNCWYLAAWVDEIGAEPLARTLLDEPLVFFRTGEGKTAALADRCAHRFAPLSAGSVNEVGIACRYHGLRFAPDGRCVENPHGPCGRAHRVRSYPVFEAHRALWVWMGDPAHATYVLPLDLSFIDAAPDTAFSKGRLTGSGHYQLFIDNILDLTHADFLHPETLGGGTFTRTRAQVAEKDGVLSLAWHAFDDTPSAVMAARLDDSVKKVDSWTEVDWAAPAIMTLRSGATRVGRTRAEGASSFNLHAMTPETRSSTHYFYAATRDYALTDDSLNRRIADMRDRIFRTEDAPMIAAQQNRIGDKDFMSLGPALMTIDEGSVRARRMLERKIAEEAEERAAAC